MQCCWKSSTQTGCKSQMVRHSFRRAAAPRAQTYLAAPGPAKLLLTSALSAGMRSAPSIGLCCVASIQQVLRVHDNRHTSQRPSISRRRRRPRQGQHGLLQSWSWSSSSRSRLSASNCNGQPTCFLRRPAPASAFRDHPASSSSRRSLTWMGRAQFCRPSGDRAPRSGRINVATCLRLSASQTHKPARPRQLTE